jgi:hypothetical protein
MEQALKCRTPVKPPNTRGTQSRKQGRGKERGGEVVKEVPRLRIKETAGWVCLGNRKKAHPLL